MGLLNRERYGTDAFTTGNTEFGLSSSSTDSFSDGSYVDGDGYIDDSVDATATVLDSDSHIDADHTYSTSVSNIRSDNGDEIRHTSSTSSPNKYSSVKSNQGRKRGCLGCLVAIIIAFSILMSIAGALFEVATDAFDAFDSGISIEQYDDGYDGNDDRGSIEISPDNPLINSEYDDGDKYGYNAADDVWNDYIGGLTRDDVDKLNSSEIEYVVNSACGLDDLSFLSEEHFVLRHGIAYFEAKMTNVTEDENEYGAFGLMQLIDSDGNVLSTTYFESDDIVKSGDSFVVSEAVTADSLDDTSLLNAKYAVIECYF